MSYSVDVNLLLYASDSGSPYHSRASSFLRTCASGTEILYLAWPTVMAYLRIATHPSVFENPLSPEQARCNIDQLLSLANVRVLAEEHGFWAIFQEITEDVVTRGNFVPDAHLAAILKQHGIATIYTNDRDFRKFDFLRVRKPLAGED